MTSRTLSKTIPDQQHGDILSDTEEEDCMKDSEMTWLERHWLRKDQEQRTSNSENPSTNSPSSSSTASNLSVRKRMALNHQKRIRQQDSKSKASSVEIGSITIPTLVKEESVNREEYGLKLTASHGLGIEWGVATQPKLRVFVNSFYLVEVGGERRAGPGQACGLIRVGDELKAVNQQRIQTIHQITRLTELVRSIDLLSQSGVLLVFRYGTKNDIEEEEREEAITRIQRSLEDHNNNNNSDVAQPSDYHILTDRQLIEEKIKRRRNRYPTVATCRLIPPSSSQSPESELAEEVWREFRGEYRGRFSQFFRSLPSLKLLQTPPRLPALSAILDENDDNTRDSPSYYYYDNWQTFLSMMSERLEDLTATTLSTSFILPRPLPPTQPRSLTQPMPSVAANAYQQYYHHSVSTESVGGLGEGSHRTVRLSDLLTSSTTTSTSIYPIGKVQRSSPLLQDPVMQRTFRHHIIPLHHEEVKRLLSLPSEEIILRLIRQIEEVREEVSREQLLEEEEEEVLEEEEQQEQERRQQQRGEGGNEDVRDGVEEAVDSLTKLMKNFVSLPSSFLGGGMTSVASDVSIGRTRSDSTASIASNTTFRTTSTATALTSATHQRRRHHKKRRSSGDRFVLAMTSSSVSPLPRATQYETNYAFRLPPFLLTYSLYYSLVHLRQCLWQRDYQTMFYKLLNKWMTLLRSNELEEVKRRMLRCSAWSGQSCKVVFDQRQSSADAVVDIKRYLDIVSDLVTLYFFLRGGDRLLSLLTLTPSTTTSPPPPNPPPPPSTLTSSGMMTSAEVMSQSISTSTSSHLRHHAIHFNYLPFHLHLPASPPHSSMPSTSRQLFPDDSEEEVESGEEVEEVLVSLVSEYFAVINVDVILSLCIHLHYKRCLTVCLEKMSELLGVNIPDLTSSLLSLQQQKLAVYHPSSRQNQRNTSTIPVMKIISPKKRLFSPTKSILPSSLAISPFSRHRHCPAFQSPPNPTTSSNTPAVAVRTNQRMQNLFFELISGVDVSNSQSQTNPTTILHPAHWLSVYQRTLLSRFYLCNERAVTVFCMILTMMIESNAWLSLDLVIHHFNDIITPFVMKYLLFDDDADCLFYRKTSISIEQMTARNTSVGVRRYLRHDYILVFKEDDEEVPDSSGRELNLILYYFDYLTKLVRHHYPDNKTPPRATTTTSTTTSSTSVGDLTDLTHPSLSRFLWEGSHLLHLLPTTTSPTSTALPLFPVTPSRSTDVEDDEGEGVMRVQGKRRCLINEWLELSLLLSRADVIQHQQHSSDTSDVTHHSGEHSPIPSSFATSSSLSWRKTATACVRSIVNADRRVFFLDDVDALESCLAFEEYAGFLQIATRLVRQSSVNISQSDRKEVKAVTSLFQRAMTQLLEEWMTSELQLEIMDSDGWAKRSALYREWWQQLQEMSVDYLTVTSAEQSTECWSDVLVGSINSALKRVHATSSERGSERCYQQITHVITEHLFQHLLPPPPSLFSPTILTAERRHVMSGDSMHSSALIEKIRKDLMTQLSSLFLHYLPFLDYSLLHQ